MNRAAWIRPSVACTLVLVCAPLAAQVNMGISFDGSGVRGFYLAMGEYYRVPEREVVVIHERRIPDEEIPVVLFIAQKAHVERSAIVQLRLGGRSWLDITLHYGLSPEVYYVPLRVDPGPPYGKAYGYYKNKPRSKWNTVVLEDADIVNFVNLRFISEHYGHAPDEVVRLRSSGRSFVAVHDEVSKGKANTKSNNGRGSGGKGKKK